MIAIIDEPDSPETLRHLLDEALRAQMLHPSPTTRAEVEAAKRALDESISKVGLQAEGSWRGWGEEI